MSFKAYKSVSYQVGYCYCPAFGRDAKHTKYERVVINGFERVIEVDIVCELCGEVTCHEEHDINRELACLI